MEKKLDFRHFNNMGYQKDDSLPNVKWSGNLSDSEKIYYYIKLEDLVRTIKEKKFLVELKQFGGIGNLAFPGGDSPQRREKINVCISSWLQEECDNLQESDCCRIETTARNLRESLDFSKVKALIYPVSYVDVYTFPQNYQQLLFRKKKGEQDVQELQLCVLNQQENIYLPIKDLSKFLGNIRVVRGMAAVDIEKLTETVLGQ